MGPPGLLTWRLDRARRVYVVGRVGPPRRRVPRSLAGSYLWAWTRGAAHTLGCASCPAPSRPTALTARSYAVVRRTRRRGGAVRGLAGCARLFPIRYWSRVRSNVVTSNTLRRGALFKSGILWFAAFAAVLLGIGVSLLIGFWDWMSGSESPSTTIRNFALVIAGALALPLAIWRGIVAERQVAVAQQGLLHDRYQKSAEMLGSDLLSVRLGGIYALVSLAQEHPGKYHIEIMRLFCAFVRNPTTDASAQAKNSPGRKYPRLREDVQAAVTAIATRSDAGLRHEKMTEGFRIDLSGADLLAADLLQANLSNSNLWGTNMEGASLSGANLSGSDLTCARLHYANLINANLAGSRLTSAELVHAVAQHADLSRASLGSANLSHAHLEWTDLSNANISIADLSSALLRDANLSGAILGKGTRTTLSDPPVSETVYTRVTQAQLDEARAAPDNPPKIDPAVVDAESRASLVWRGKALLDKTQ